MRISDWSSDVCSSDLANTTAGIKAQALAPDSISSSHSVAANDTTAYNPCLSCGACCAHFRVSFYCGEITGESGGTVPPELVTQVGPLRACMQGTEYGGKRCTALRGELGQRDRKSTRLNSSH